MIMQQAHNPRRMHRAQEGSKPLLIWQKVPPRPRQLQTKVLQPDMYHLLHDVLRITRENVIADDILQIARRGVDFPAGGDPLDPYDFGPGTCFWEEGGELISIETLAEIFEMVFCFDVVQGGLGLHGYNEPVGWNEDGLIVSLCWVLIQLSVSESNSEGIA